MRSGYWVWRHRGNRPYRANRRNGCIRPHRGHGRRRSYRRNRRNRGYWRFWRRCHWRNRSDRSHWRYRRNGGYWGHRANGCHRCRQHRAGAYGASRYPGHSRACRPYRCRQHRARATGEHRCNWRHRACGTYGGDRGDGAGRSRRVSLAEHPGVHSNQHVGLHDWRRCHRRCQFFCDAMKMNHLQCYRADRQLLPRTNCNFSQRQRLCGTQYCQLLYRRTLHYHRKPRIQRRRFFRGHIGCWWCSARNHQRWAFR